MPPIIPPDTDPKEAARIVADLLSEARHERQKREKTLKSNQNRYLGEHWENKPPEGMSHFVINRTQRSIIASAAVQTEQRPRTNLSPMESNEPAIVYLSRDGVNKVKQVGEQFQLPLEPGQLAGQEPFDEEVMDEMLLITVAVPVEQPEADASGDGAEPEPADSEPGGDGQAPDAPAAPQVVQQPVFTDDDFVVVDDRLATEAMQTVYDLMWDRASADYHWFDNVLGKLIFGYQPMLVQWDFDKHRPDLHNEHQLHLWIDPTAHDIEDADYLIYDQPMSADEARRKYPQFKQQIDKVAREGQINENTLDEEGASLSAAFRDTDFQRRMVIVRTAWLRHQPIPKSPEQALRDGDVTQATEQAIDEQTQAPIEQPVTDDEGNPVFQLADGALTAPDNDNWPTRDGILQLTIIGNQAVEQVENPYVEIPFAWNINIPIPFKPFGQGEPERLFDLQEAVNRVTSNLHNHLKYYPHPQEYLPASVKVANKNNSPHAHPGRRIWVPDDVYQQFLSGRQKGFAVDPPTLPASYVQFLQMLLTLLDEESDNSQVLQGNAPGGVESGRAISLLQNAARGTIGFKSLYTERAIVQYARLVLGMIRDFLPESEWVRMVSGYPEQVLLAVRQRAKNLEYDVRVEVVSGRGQNRELRKQQATEEFQMGLRSRESTMRLREIEDPEDEIRRIMADPLMGAGVANQSIAMSPSSGSTEQ